MQINDDIMVIPWLLAGHPAEAQVVAAVNDNRWTVRPICGELGEEYTFSSSDLIKRDLLEERMRPWQPLRDSGWSVPELMRLVAVSPA